MGKAGLICSQKNSINNYRIFTSEHIRQLLTLNAIKLSVQTQRLKHFFRTMKETYETFDYSNRDELTKFLENILIRLNQMNRLQIRGITDLYKLCEQVETGLYPSMDSY